MCVKCASIFSTYSNVLINDVRLNDLAASTENRRLDLHEKSCSALDPPEYANFLIEIWRIRRRNENGLKYLLNVGKNFGWKCVEVCVRAAIYWSQPPAPPVSVWSQWKNAPLLPMAPQWLRQSIRKWRSIDEPTGRQMAAIFKLAAVVVISSSLADHFNWIERVKFVHLFFPRAETINIFLVLGRLWIANEAARHRFRVPSLLLLLSGQPPRAVRLKATPDYYVSGCRSVWIDGQTGLSRSLFHYFGLVLFHLSACVIHSSIGGFRMATNRATISAIRWRRC